MRYITLLVILLLGCHSTNAQKDSLKIIVLDSVEIKALRIEIPSQQQPFSIATYTATTLQETRQQLSLQEYLTHIPGLFSLNANNYAQDLRISIRGFGARSAFGIRGVKIIVDGIPETTPDGQGQIDNLNLGIVEKIEVLKGPSSTLYGNASGGIIHITTKQNFNTDFLEAGLTLGSYNNQQYQITSGIVKNNSKIIFQATHTLSDGYRDQSGLKNTNLNLRWFQKLSDKSKINFQANYTNSPIGDDAGGLTLEEVNADRRQARDRNIQFGTGEAIEQFKIGSTYNYSINEKQDIQFYGFYNHRNFEGRLPFNFGGWIDLNRNYFGQGGHYKIENKAINSRNTLQLGYDFASQKDIRQRFTNDDGTRGTNTLDQIERFTNIAFYALDHFYIKKWLVTAGLRFDSNILKVTDQKLDNGNQSGRRNLSSVNPSLGVNYQLANQLNLYGNFRSSFETPSLSELSANPTGEDGFNNSLDPQRAFNYEIGFKGLVCNRLSFDLALFYINTKNDLVPFELEAFPDRSFFRNAGTTERTGAELSTNYSISSEFSVQGSYTYSNFKYTSFTLPQGDFSENALPGIPKHFTALSFLYKNVKGFNARLQHRFVDTFFANDANSVSEPSYHIADFSMSYRFKGQHSIWSPFFGINNIFDAKYSDNIRLNAFGGRYFEPAPGINFYVGIRYKLSE